MEVPNSLNIPVPKGVRIAVVGDIHEHEYQFNALVDQLQPSDKLWLVSVGDIYDKGDGKQAAERITDTFRSLHQRNIGYLVQGNHEKKNIKAAKRQKQMTDQLLWLDQQPLVLSFVFDNSTRLTVLHGGVRPTHKWSDLNVDIETCYIRNLDASGDMIKLEWVDSDTGEKELRPAKAGGKSWHLSYDGRFGYIAAGHEPQKDGIAKFYNYSCNLDTACYHTGSLTAQIFNEDGRDQLLTVKGPAKRGNLSEI